ncbi:hypothetical protein ABIE20_005266 [Pseudomonas sp. 2835]
MRAGFAGDRARSARSYLSLLQPPPQHSHEAYLALVLFCPNYSSDSYPVLIRNKRFAIHLLSGAQQAEAYAFAREGKDKAQGIAFR